MSFTTDWFSNAAPHIAQSFLRTQHVENILEIGSWEGRSTCWFLDACPNATITCVDTFEGSVEHEGINMSDVEKRFRENVQPYGTRVVVRKGRSDRMLFGLDPESFDVIYVDGSHEHHDALSDLVFAYHLLRPGGVLLVDDYAGFPGVRAAVDAFVQAFKGLEPIHVGYQVHFVKK